MDPRKETGNLGEKQAQIYLQGCGYRILDVNWRYKHLEADIIAMDNNVLVFVEVKTRSSTQFGYPEDFVDVAKQKKLIRLANIYLARCHHQGDIRFDIVAIVWKEQMDVTHIKDAFWHY